MKAIVGKIIVTSVGVTTILILNVMDMNETHLTNPLWTGHARFHWAIEHMQTCLLNMLAIFLVWQKRASRTVLLISCLLPMFFWGLFPFTTFFPGTDSWPDGVAHPTNWPKWLNQFPPHKIFAIVSCTLCIAAASIFLLNNNTNHPTNKTL